MDPYEKNLQELKVKFPAVYEHIVRAEDPGNIELIKTTSGLNNLRVKGQGKSLCLYDMEDPLREEGENLKTINFLAGQITFIVGIGLGYAIQIILGKMKEGHKIVVLETNPAILRLAMKQIDVAEAIKENTLIFSLPDEESIKLTVVKYSTDLTPQDIIVVGTPKMALVWPKYADLKELVMKHIGFSMISTFTVLNNGGTFVKNEFANFPKFLFSPGIGRLHDKFKGVPGIIVSAGPSLERNIHYLREAKGKTLIVATAPVVRVLLAYDIKPHLAVSIDFAKENRIHFEGLCDRSDIPLV